MNWEVIMWSCVTVIVLLGIFAIILTFISARNMRKNRQAMQEPVSYTHLDVYKRQMYSMARTMLQKKRSQRWRF